MNKQKLLALTSSVCLILILAVSMIVSACAAPAPAPKPSPAPAPAPTPPPKPVELKIAHMEPAGSFMDKFFQSWAKKVETESKGLLTFRIYPGATLVSAFDTYDAVAKGVTDIGASYRYGAPGSEFMTSMSTFFAGVPDTATATRILDEVRKQFASVVDKEWTKSKLLWTTTAGPAMIGSKPRAVRTLEDLKGLQVRVPVKPASEILTALGGTPVGMPLGEVAVALEKGTVEGATIQGYALKAYKFGELMKYCTQMTLYAPPDWFAVMNWDSYNKLSPDLQKVINDNMEFGKKETVKALDDADADGIAFAKNAGMQFITLTPEEKKRWLAIINPVQDQQAAAYDAKGYPDTEVLKFIRSRIAEYVK